MAAIIRPKRLDSARRRLLKDMAFGLVALPTVPLLLPGCEAPRTAGEFEMPPPGEAEDAALPMIDTDALKAQIWMEEDAIQAYDAAITLLSEDLVPVAELFRDHHREHRASAVDALAAMGVGEPGPSPALENLPDLSGGDVPVLQYALTLEKQAVRAYLGLIAQMESWVHRRSAANIFGSEISHFLALSAALGDGSVRTFTFADLIFDWPTPGDAAEE